MNWSKMFYMYFNSSVRPVSHNSWKNLLFDKWKNKKTLILIRLASYYSCIKEKQKSLLCRDKRPITLIILISFEKQLSEPLFGSVNDQIKLLD